MLKVILTEDQSTTIFSPEFNEHYHSIHGAIQESKHIFIEAGLKQVTNKNEISVLEVGLGTGLNCLLTCLEAKKDINYTALELYPLPTNVIKDLNYIKLLNESQAQELFDLIHQVQWEKWQKISPMLQLLKRNIALQEFATDCKFDLIYFDAFGPGVQAELWTEDIFKKVHQMCNPGAILVTFCCKGAVQRALKASGFVIEKIPGPPGKREILRARIS